MSRRREAQDLERALTLSAQDETRQDSSSSSLSTPPRPSCESSRRSPRRTSPSAEDQGEDLGAHEPAENYQTDEAATPSRVKRPKLSSEASGDAHEASSQRDSAPAPHKHDAKPAQEASRYIPSNVVTSSRSPSPSKLDVASARKRLFGKRTFSFSTDPAITTLLPSSPSHVPGLRRHVRLPPLHVNRRSPPPPKPRLPKKETKKTTTDSGSEEGEPEPEIDYENEGFL